jgi:hypothetical protein
LVAACRVTVLGALSGNSFGVASAGAPAVSVFTITLSGGGIDQADAAVTVTPETAAGGARATVAQTGGSDTIFAVSTFDGAGAAADRAFQFSVFRKAVG